MKLIPPPSAIITINFLASCKKTLSTEDLKSEAQQANQANRELLDLFTQKLKDKPKSFIEMLHIKGKGYYADMNGNRIPFVPRNTTIGIEGNTCLGPADSEIEQELVSFEREYTCGVGYRFVVTYKIISEFYMTDGTSPNLSGGRVRLRNGSTTIYTLRLLQHLFIGALPQL